MTSDSAHTVDAFLSGAFQVVQPARGGHRSGLDAILLAAAVPSGSTGRLADLGAGAGVAGMAAAVRSPAVTSVLVENHPDMVAYARSGLDLPVNCDLAKRLRVVEADITAPYRTRKQAGLDNEAFDWVIANPPYNDATHRAAATPMKRQAHEGDAEVLQAWLTSMHDLAKPGGSVAVIVRPSALPGLLSGSQQRLGGVRIVPISARAGRAASRIVLIATKGSHARLELLPPVVLHEDNGAYRQEIDALLRGERDLLSVVG